jgi:hypothetical protein
LEQPAGGELGSEIRRLTADLAIAKRERTQQAQYAVKLEDELNELKEEREFFILAIRHLQWHRDCALYSFCTEESCTEEVHQKVRPYLQ